jgi:hypothetical protein
VIERLETGTGGGDEDPERLRKRSAGFLGPEGTDVDEAFRTIEDLVLKSSPVADGTWPLGSLNDIAKASVVSHSIAAYAGSLERTHLQKLSARINSDTTRWLSHLFR